MCLSQSVKSSANRGASLTQERLISARHGKHLDIWLIMQRRRLAFRLRTVLSLTLAQRCEHLSKISVNHSLKPMGLGTFSFGIMQVNVLLWFVLRLFSDRAICLVVGNPPSVVPETKLLHCSCSACLCSSPDLQGCMQEMKLELH